MNFFSQIGSSQAFTNIDEIKSTDEFMKRLKSWLKIHSKIEDYSDYYINEGFNMGKRTTGHSASVFAEWELKTVKDLVYNVEQALIYFFGSLEKVPIHYVKSNYKETFRITRLISIYTELIKILEFLEGKIETVNPEKDLNIPTNPYPEIFTDYFSFRLFERLYDSYKDNRETHLAYFSFLYRKMWNEDLIREYQTPGMFRLWLSKEPFKIVIEYKFKTLANCAPESKLSEYETAKELVKLELNRPI